MNDQLTTLDEQTTNLLHWLHEINGFGRTNRHFVDKTGCIVGFGVFRVRNIDRLLQE